MSLGITGTKIHMKKIRRFEIIEGTKFKVWHSDSKSACGRNITAHGWVETFSGMKEYINKYNESCCSKCVQARKDLVKEILNQINK